MRQALALDPSQGVGVTGDALQQHPNRQKSERCPPINVSDVYPVDIKYSADTIAKFPIEAARVLPTLVFSPFLASYGSSMWKNYRRRVQSTIRQPREFGENGLISVGSGDSPSGTLAVLMTAIAEAVGKQDSNVKFILIGHSTGTLMLAELVSLCLGVHKADCDEEKQNGQSAACSGAASTKIGGRQIEIEKFVFLGAAATVGDFNETLRSRTKLPKPSFLRNTVLWPNMKISRSPSWSMSPEAPPCQNSTSCSRPAALRNPSSDERSSTGCSPGKGGASVPEVDDEDVGPAVSVEVAGQSLSCVNDFRDIPLEESSGGQVESAAALIRVHLDRGGYGLIVDGEPSRGIVGSREDILVAVTIEVGVGDSDSVRECPSMDTRPRVP